MLPFEVTLAYSSELWTCYCLLYNWKRYSIPTL